MRSPVEVLSLLKRIDRQLGKPELGAG